MLTRQQVVYGLERVELRSTDLFDECPFRSASIPGFPERKRQFTGGVRDPDGDGYCVGLDMLYRSADGSCNNMKHPEWGASLTPFLRFLPPDYSDGVQAFRKAKSGDELPNPRLISTTVHQVFIQCGLRWETSIEIFVRSSLPKFFSSILYK